MVSCFNCELFSVMMSVSFSFLTMALLGPLHLTFYAIKVLLYRALMHPATKAAKSQPNSNLRQWFAYALADFTQFTEFFVGINMGDFRGFWGRRKLL